MWWLRLPRSIVAMFFSARIFCVPLLSLSLILTYAYSAKQCYANIPTFDPVCHWSIADDVMGFRVHSTRKSGVCSYITCVYLPSMGRAIGVAPG